VVVLVRSVQGQVAASAVRGCRAEAAVRGCKTFPPQRAMASTSTGTGGPVYNSIVQAVTEALQPAELQLVDDSAAHASHRAMKGKATVEVCVLA